MATSEPVNKEVTLPPIEVSPTPEPAKTPALPEGFSLDSPTPSAGPDLPPGFTLDGMNVPTGDVSSGPTKDEPLTNIDDTKEAPFLQRLAAGFKMTPEGRKSYYEAMGHKIAVDQNGDMWAHDSQNGDFYPIDRKGLNVDDLADVMGAGARMAVEVAPQIGMAIYPPTAAASISPQGAAIGAGIGNVVSQAMSAALPGEDYPQDSFMQEAGQRAMNVADAMAFSGVAQKGINAAGQIFDFFRPDNFAKRVTDKLLDAPEAKEHLRISQSAKTPATLAQITDSPLARSSEKLALNYPSTSAHMKNAYNQQYQAAVTNLDNVLNTIHPGQVSNTFLGTKVGTAYEQTVKAAKAARRAAADQDFIITDSPLGKRPIIQASSTVAALKKKLSNVSVRGFMAGPLMKNKEKELLDTLKSFVDKAGKPVRMTPKEMQIALESWGDAAGGSGKVFKDMETKEARTIRIASSVYRGLLNDLSNASQAGKPGAVSLQQARNNWLKNSQVLEEIKNTTIGKKLNLDPDIVATKPEEIAKALMRMDKTEAAQNINFLKRYDPASVGVVKRSYFDQALTDAGKPIDVSVPTKQKFGVDEFNASKYVNTLKNSVAWPLLAENPQQWRAMTDSFKSIEMIANGLGKSNSEGSGAWYLFRTLRELGGDALTLSVAKMSRKLGGLYIARKLVDHLADPTTAQALKAVAVQPKTKVGQAAILHIARLIVSEQMAHNLPPNAVLNGAYLQETPELQDTVPGP